MSRKRASRQEIVASPEKQPKLCLYLEDNTPIRTIEVGNVPTDLSEDRCKSYIQGYFERDGPVDSVAIEKKTDKEWAAFVTFVLPDDAAELIQNKEAPGYTRCAKFPIKIADDAHQIPIDPAATNLEKVNDHCLLLILSHLTLMDAINLCKTSTRMQAAGQLFYRKYGKFSFGMATGDSSINEANLPVILEAIGDHIWSIDWHQLKATHFQLLLKHCPNVTELRLSSAKRDINVLLSQNKQFFANLKRLYMESCTSIYDNNLKCMLSGNQVKTLDLHGCSNIRGNMFNKNNRIKLRTLKMVDCRNVRDTKWFNLADWKNKLSILALDTCCSYLPCLSLPLEKLRRIKELQLDFSCFKGVTDTFNFAGLNKLTKITLARNHQYNFIDANNMITGLAQIDSLESLEIQGINIDSNTIQGLRSIKNLRYLRMTRIDNKIGRNLYEQVREYLSTLQELSMHSGRVELINGKAISDIIVGMKLKYFSHSSITWEWLDGLRPAKSTSDFGAKPPLKIGVPDHIFIDPKKDAFEAAHAGAITLCIHK